MSTLKRSTLSRNKNLNVLIREEVVKRFETVVKEEVRRHNVAIEKSNQDLEQIKELFEEHKRELVDLKQQNVSAYLRTQDLFQEEVDRMERGFESQRKHIGEGLKRIQKALEELSKKADEFLAVSVFDKYKEETKKEMSDMKKNTAEVVSYVDQQNDIQKNHTVSEIKSLHETNKKNLDQFRMQISDFDRRLSSNIVDAAGLQRSIKIDEVTLNVIEKKIENIYTLIERKKNGGKLPETLARG